MMMRDAIALQIKQIISAQLNIPIENIKGSSKIHGHLGLDSLDVVNLLSAINMEFHIKLLEVDVLELETLDELVDCVKERLDPVS